MGLFSGYARQAAALPPIQPMAAPPQPQRGLIGGSPRISWQDRLAMMGTTLQGGASVADQERARMEQLRQEQDAQASRQVEDRLRAQLSPADGPDGSGTGAAPTTDQQMAVLNDARLLNPEVANRFAPGVQSQRMDEMTRALPLEQRLAIQLNPESAGQSFASQFKDETLSEGSIRTRGSQTVAGAPTTDRFDDRFGTFDPITGQTTYSQPRGPTYQEQTVRDLGQGNLSVAQGRLGLDRDQSGYTLGQGQERYGVDGTLLASNDPAPNPADNEDRAAIAGFQTNNQRFQNLIGMVGGVPAQGNQAAQPPAFDLSPANALGYKAALATGVGMTPAAAAYGNYVSEIRSAVSDALRLNVGPQTDQDAIREAQALLSNIDNRDYVLQRLPTVIANNNRLAAGRAQLMQQRQPQQAQAPQGGQQGSAGSQVAYDAQGNRFVVRNGQWVRE